MRKRNLKVIAAVCCMAALATAVYAAGGAGSSDDPLVTLSYLEQVFAPQMETTLDEMVEQAVENLTPGQAGSVFQVVTLTQGQTLVGDVGCEVMLRVGSAKCVTNESTGIIDTTDGTVLNNGGDLVKNHLYMVTISTRSVTATADTTKVLVRGPYTLA